MAIAATSYCFSSLSSSFTHRFSLSSSHRGSATPDVSICFVAPKASSNNNNQNRRIAFKSSREVHKEDVSQKKFLGRSIDGKSGRGEKGWSQSTALKSPVMQKDKWDYMAEMMEQQIGQGNNQYEAFHNAVVKVYSTHSEPDYSVYSHKKKHYTTASSAFMIGDGKLITSANYAQHATQIKVKRRGDDTIYLAEVLARGEDCNIVLLSVESKEFWKGAEPLKFGRLPFLQDAVAVLGYTPGGDTISSTKGAVSSIELTSSATGLSDFLIIQIDAAIRSGYDGGPAFNDQGECIGVTYRSEDPNFGYVIPSTVVLRFLNDFERNGKYTGFPSLGVMWQKLENPALRACLRIHSNEGVLVRRVEPTADANNVLKAGDVIVSFDDVRVGCDGTVPFRPSERIDFLYLLNQKFAGDVVELGIIRAGSFMKVNVTVNPRVHLVPLHRDGCQPSYFTTAGLVFTPLSRSFIDAEGENCLRLKLKTKSRHSLARFKGEQIVVLSQILSVDVNSGYNASMHNLQVLRLNGTRIKNIHHLAHLVDSCKYKYLVFEFENNIVAAFDKKAATDSDILEEFEIPADRSDDLLEPYEDPLGEKTNR